MIQCHGKGCPNKIGSDRWSKTRAQEKGWFFKRTGEAWCASCIPAWVKAWRKGSSP